MFCFFFTYLRSGRTRCRPVHHCWKSTFRRPQLTMVSFFTRVSFPFFPALCEKFERNSLNMFVQIFSRDCQKAHLHETSTNTRVSGPDFRFLEDIVFILWFILMGVQVSGLLFSPNFQHTVFSLCFHLSFRLLSVSPPRPCGIRRIMSRQWCSLWRYAYLLLPLWAGWAGRPWCWLPDKERAGQSEDSQHQS